MNKETKELTALILGLVDSVFQSTEDKDFDIKTDFTNFVDDLLRIQPAIQGFKSIASELKTMNEEEDVAGFEDIRKAGNLVMSNVPEISRYHVTNIYTGLLSVFALGQKKGREQLIDELKEGKEKLDNLI